MVALLSQCLYQLDFYAWFKLNEDYIANNLCENKSKPEMKCHGKCFLMKKIREAHQKQEKQDIKNKEIVLLLPKTVLLLPFVRITSSIKQKIVFLDKVYQSPSLSVPVPPPNYIV